MNDPVWNVLKAATRGKPLTEIKRLEAIPCTSGCGAPLQSLSGCRRRSVFDAWVGSTLLWLCLPQVLEWLQEENLRSYAPLCVHHDLVSLV
jgi:hypothetical protein